MVKKEIEALQHEEDDRDVLRPPDSSDTSFSPTGAKRMGTDLVLDGRQKRQRRALNQPPSLVESYDPSRDDDVESVDLSATNTETDEDEEMDLEQDPSSATFTEELEEELESGDRLTQYMEILQGLETSLAAICRENTAVLNNVEMDGKKQELANLEKDRKAFCSAKRSNVCDDTACCELTKWVHSSLCMS